MASCEGQAFARANNKKMESLTTSMTGYANKRQCTNHPYRTPCEQQKAGKASCMIS